MLPELKNSPQAEQVKVQSKPPYPISALSAAAVSCLPDLSLEKVERAYSSPPWWYDVRGFFILTFSYRGTLWSQISFFAKNISENHLEVGIGTGTLFRMILWFRKWSRRAMGRVVGIDYCERMLEGARHDFRKNKSVQLEKMDVMNMGFWDGEFQTINVANALHCFSDPDTALRELHRVLAYDGVLALNALLYPRGIAPLRWLATRINTWGIQKGILVTPFGLEEIRNKVTAHGFRISQEFVTGNAWYLVARKSDEGF